MEGATRSSSSSAATSRRLGASSASTTRSSRARRAPRSPARSARPPRSTAGSRSSGLVWARRRRRAGGIPRRRLGLRAGSVDRSVDVVDRIRADTASLVRWARAAPAGCLSVRRCARAGGGALRAERATGARHPRLRHVDVRAHRLARSPLRGGRGGRAAARAPGVVVPRSTDRAPPFGSVRPPGPPRPVHRARKGERGHRALCPRPRRRLVRPARRIQRRVARVRPRARPDGRVLRRNSRTGAAGGPTGLASAVGTRARQSARRTLDARALRGDECRRALRGRGRDLLRTRPPGPTRTPGAPRGAPRALCKPVERGRSVGRLDRGLGVTRRERCSHPNVVARSARALTPRWLGADRRSARSRRRTPPRPGGRGPGRG